MRSAVKVPRPLSQPMLLLGVEKSLAWANITIGGAFVLGQRWYWWIPIALATHVALRYYSRREPQLKDVFLRFSRQADHYDPWWHPLQKEGDSVRNQNVRYRPKYLGRGEPR